MKRNALAIAVAGLMAAPVASFAELGPTLYGQGHVSLDLVNNDENTDLNVSSNSSRIGVKGSHDLGNGLAAIYLMEWTVNMSGDGGSSNTLSSRNRYVGLKSDTYGTLVAGKHDTPEKVVGRKVDLFWSTQLGDNRSITNLNGFDARTPNTIGYISPNFGPVHIFAAYVSDSEFGNSKPGNTDDHKNNAYSGALIFDQNGLYLAAAGTIANINDNVNTVSKDSTSSIRGVAKYTMNDWTFTFLAEKDYDIGFTNGDDQFLMGGGVAYKMGNNVFKGQVYWADETELVDSSGSIMYAAGWDYYFSKAVQVYLQGVYMYNDDNAANKIGGSGTGHGDAAQPLAAGDNVWGLSTGMRIKF